MTSKGKSGQWKATVGGFKTLFNEGIDASDIDKFRNTLLDIAFDHEHKCQRVALALLAKLLFSGEEDNSKPLFQPLEEENDD